MFLASVSALCLNKPPLLIVKYSLDKLTPCSGVKDLKLVQPLTLSLNVIVVESKLGNSCLSNKLSTLPLVRSCST